MFTTGGIGSESGLGRSLLAFHVEGDGSGTEGCRTTANGALYANLKIFGNADGIEWTGCPGDDRYEALSNDDCGSALDLTMTPTPTGLVSVAAGETWNFQAWHRDSVAGTSTSNRTDGVAVMFQ